MLSYHDPHFSATLQMNNWGGAICDAINVRPRTDPVAGYIPAYTFVDLSASHEWKNVPVKGGINNITNKTYCIRRTCEYPGLGILPAVGSGVYVVIRTPFVVKDGSKQRWEY